MNFTRTKTNKNQSAPRSARRPAGRGANRPVKSPSLLHHGSIRHLGEILRIRVRWKEEIETLISHLDVFGRNVRL